MIEYFLEHGNIFVFFVIMTTERFSQSMRSDIALDLRFSAGVFDYFIDTESVQSFSRMHACKKGHIVGFVFCVCL